MDHPKFPLLFSPLKINQVELSNRIVLPAMVTRLPGVDGSVNQDTIDRYVRYAKGEMGMIVVEATAIHTVKSGQLLRLGSDEFIEGHRQLVQQVHDASPTKLSVQIIHFLKIARSGWRQTVEMLTREEIHSIIQWFGDTAARAREAGYDAIELHMAHAYTLASFLSGVNKRRDEYGGRTLESRMRLMSEVIGNVRSKAGDDYAVGARMNGEEFIKGGYALNDSTRIALRMAQLGLDYISVSAGGKFEDAIKHEGKPLDPYSGYSGERAMPPDHMPRGVNVYLAETIKKFINEHGYHTPVITAGRIPTPDIAEQVLQDGRADLVAIARPQLADADWAKKARMGNDNKIIRCSYDNICKQLEENFKQVRCGHHWPQENLHAPIPSAEDETPPIWTTDGALEAKLDDGYIRLSWEEAEDEVAMYGYDIYRSVNGGDFVYIYAVNKPSHRDEDLLAGNTYAYFIRPYDLAGNRGPESNVVELQIDTGFELPAGKTIAIDKQVGLESGGASVI
jgi:2,4-dienoyl-CoA reductase-like NADH-dependent reductase (Old Yellow Enzyme family)